MKPPPLDGRARILEAAIQSFAELGYAGTTTAKVARDASVTQPLVHHHFGSKEGLWRAAVDHLFADLPELIDESSEANRLGVAVERFVRLAASRPALSRLLAREGATPGPRLDFVLEKYLRKPFDEAVKELKARQREGLVAPGFKPELLLFFVLGAGGYLFDVPGLAKAAFGIDATAESTRDQYVELVREVLRTGVLLPAGVAAVTQAERKAK
jgi:TetR/AcrR family transcriptional regulator